MKSRLLLSREGEAKVTHAFERESDTGSIMLIVNVVGIGSVCGSG